MLGPEPAWGRCLLSVRFFHFNGSFIISETVYAVQSLSPSWARYFGFSFIVWHSVFQVSRSWLRLSVRGKGSDLFMIDWATSRSATQCVHHANNGTPRISYSGYLPTCFQFRFGTSRTQFSAALSPGSLNTVHSVLFRPDVSFQVIVSVMTVVSVDCSCVGLDNTDRNTADFAIQMPLDVAHFHRAYFALTLLVQRFRRIAPLTCAAVAATSFDILQL